MGYRIPREVTMNKLAPLYKIACAVAMLTAIVIPAKAQNDLGDEEINVVKAYQPTLSDAFKISDVPQRDTAVAYTPDLNYEIAPVQHQTVYTITPIKPLRIKDESIKKLYRGFIKAGYGTKNTPYGEIFYNSLRSKTSDAGLHFSHISSNGKIEDSGYPGMSETGIKVSGTRFFDNNNLKADAGYNRNVYHYYGYDDPPDIFSKSDTKHSFDDYFANVAFKSTDKDNDRLRYTGGLSFYGINDNRDNDESDLIFHGNVGKMVNDFDMSGDIVLDFLKHENKSYGSENHNIIRLNPRVGREIDRMKLSAGLNMAVEINDLTEYHFYPHLRVDYTLISDAMTAFGQLTGNLERNSFRNYSKENPFLGIDHQLKNSNHKIDISGGLHLKLDKQLAFIGSVTFRRIDDDAFYYNLPPSSTLVVYDVLYQENSQTNLHGELIWDQGEKTCWSLAADYYNNNTEGDSKALFRPDFKLTLNGYYTMGEKIFLTTQWSYVTSRYAVDYNDINGDGYTTLKGFLDANLGVEYRYTKVMSFFANFNNFTASKYSRWYNYPSYRFGALAGLTYSF